MTTILIRRQRIPIRGLTASGMPVMRMPDSDIICAAVSVLVFNTLNADRKLYGRYNECSDKRRGRLVDVVFESPVSDRAKLLLDTMILGLTRH